MSSREFEANARTKLAPQAKTAEAEQASAVRHNNLAPTASGAADDPGPQDAALARLGGWSAHSGSSLLQLQRGYGNRHVQQVVKQTAPAPIVQAKLLLGPADDRYEREADRVAQQVASDRAAPASDANSRPPTIQRVGGIEGGAVDASVQQAIQAARGGGQPLPEGVCASMEQALGTDFGGVRVHADAQADRLNRALQARAFTTGQDLFFRRGEYSPASSGGRRLLAHELTHVVQQRGDATDGKASAPDSISRPSGAGGYVQRKIIGKDGSAMSEDQALATIPAMVAAWLATDTENPDVRERYAKFKKEVAPEVYDRLMVDAIKELVNTPERIYRLDDNEEQRNIFGRLVASMEWANIKLENSRRVLEGGLPFGTNNHVLVQNARALFNAGIAQGWSAGEQFYGANPVSFSADIATVGEPAELEKWEVGFTQTMISSTLQLELQNAENWTFIVDEMNFDSYNDSLSIATQPWMARQKDCRPHGSSVTVTASDAPRVTIPSPKKPIPSVHVRGLDEYRTWLILHNKTSRQVVYLAEWSWEVHYGDGHRDTKQTGTGAKQKGEMKQATRAAALSGKGAVLSGQIANEVAQPKHEEVLVYLPGKENPSMSGSVQDLQKWI